MTDGIGGKSPVNFDHLQSVMEALMFDSWGDAWTVERQTIGYIHPLKMERLTEIGLMLGNALNGSTGTVVELSQSISFGTAMAYS